MRYYRLDALVEASGLSEAALGRAVGLSGTTLKRARERGLREDAADRYATRAGFAALEVWPDFGLRECEECAGLFAQTRQGHRFCSRNCADRRGARRRWQDPDYREKKLAAIRVYREEAKRARLAKARARYWSDPERMRAERRARYHAQKSTGPSTTSSGPQGQDATVAA